jgi:hypothetical protein
VDIYELPASGTPGATDYPPGTIGVSMGETWRHAGSLMCVIGCWKPWGTRTMFAQSISVPFNMNRIIRATLADPTLEWLHIQADDQLWSAMAIKQLLDRQLDVVVPLILRRGPPFIPVIYKELSEHGYIPFGYDELPTTGLVECCMAGSGGMLVRRNVLEAIGDPWFEYEPHGAPDFVFAKKILAAGYKIWADMEVRMGHIGAFAIWPHATDKTWQIGFDMGRSKQGKSSTFYFDPKEAQKEADQ